MVGSSAFYVKYEKKDMAIPIKTKDPVNIKDSVVEVNSQLFFQRLIVSIQPEEDPFSYELCRRPISLIEKKSLMNEAHTPAVRSVLFDQPGLSQCIIPDILQNTHYVLEGWGSLLQKLPWAVGSTSD